MKDGTYVDDKGYLRISAGPHRGKRVHTMIAEAMLGRELLVAEQVHHLDGNKLNCDWRNLQVMNERDHGAVSAKQAWYFKEHDVKLKKEWDEWASSSNDVSFNPGDFECPPPDPVVKDVV